MRCVSALFSVTIVIPFPISVETKINSIAANSCTRCVIVIKRKITKSFEFAVVDHTYLTNEISRPSIDIMMVFEND